ncbi:shikimate dehydrogenase family protein [Bifidobacterium scardovii]|uniref:Shikimate dehydrogenase n=1 Tax=Bifidobacterium scardovii TaxID=158787 RepID=A0A087D676_9BIFI|nr:shikimate dehydrogenase [Bifidobacterium scardovii]KFI91026.1 shikimate dehydrogenase [Bifidobacterium scardovii]MDK6349625.1 shikimate dehydrogenase [Bifidobacterium scardovii]MDU8981077.1 shikimate dehydrogenase [Bifidobacterium scardovii]BAQ31428.1 shikimate 5-dehydrogenase [Bifidobacterium scardovii JCM 12489 = DSM 13734]
MTEITHRCAVLGKPIAHSLSPVLHAAAYKALGLDDWAYERHEVGESDLDGFLRGLDPTWRGLSLTMPLKKTIQSYGTPADIWEQRLKVANTAVFDWSALGAGGLPSISLYNTDVMGIVLAFGHELRSIGQPDRWSGAHDALVIGNGNTASSAVAAATVMLANRQPDRRITVAARHPGKNPRLRGILDGNGPEGSGAFGYREIPIDASFDALRGADIVVSTIPGHAADMIAEVIEADDAFFPRGILLDVVYDPRPSALMRAWRAKGGLAIGGEEMLLWQAVLQVILMTGGNPSDDALMGALEPAMRQALEEAL